MSGFPRECPIFDEHQQYKPRNTLNPMISGTQLLQLAPCDEFPADEKWYLTERGPVQITEEDVKRGYKHLGSQKPWYQTSFTTQRTIPQAAHSFEEKLQALRSMGLMCSSRKYSSDEDTNATDDE